MHILSTTPGGIGRRERFILATAIGSGIGVTIVPEWITNNLWPASDGMSSATAGIRDAVIITLSTGYRCDKHVPDLRALGVLSKREDTSCQHCCAQHHSLVAVRMIGCLLPHDCYTLLYYIYAAFELKCGLQCWDAVSDVSQLDSAA